MIKRALISVWNKEGIIELANFLTNNNIEIISTGGTKKVLEENNIKVTSISDITGRDSVMDGRVKTLDSKIFGSILADRGNANHLEDLDMIGGSQIDIVVVNFYPFEENAVKKNLDLENSIEYIDIGGSTLIRSAAKNFNDVVVISNASDYPKLVNELKNNKGATSINFRKLMSAKAFGITAYYDSVVSNWLNNKLNIKLWQKIQMYGKYSFKVKTD